MNFDINQLINEHGQEISDRLRIATEQVYDKVLWYIRIKGATNLVEVFFFIVYLIILSVLLRWFIYKTKELDWDESDRFFLGLIIFLGGGVSFAILWIALVSTIISSISMIIAPEFYIINQIVENIGK